MAYLFPYVCFACRRCFRRAFASGLPDKTCPRCGGPSVAVSRKFKAPRATDRAQWEKVRFLIDHGFRFETIRDSTGAVVAYPKTLAEARDFVRAHALRARTTGRRPRARACDNR